jgi:hypothetical protein
MGTKNSPGKFDCYQAADPDEPMFVLLGRDEKAPGIIREWVEKRSLKRDLEAGSHLPHDEKALEALRCADEMVRYYRFMNQLCRSCGRPATHYTVDGIDSEFICEEYNHGGCQEKG